MKCQTCKSERIASVTAWCRDSFNASIGAHEYDGYVPKDMGIGGGDGCEFSYCLDCGQMQGTWALGPTDLEQKEDDL